MRRFVYTLERDPDSIEGNPQRPVGRDALCAVLAASSGTRGIHCTERSARGDPRPQFLLQFPDDATEDLFESRIQLALEIRGLRIHRIEAYEPAWHYERWPTPPSDAALVTEAPLPDPI